MFVVTSSCRRNSSGIMRMRTRMIRVALCFNSNQDTTTNDILLALLQANLLFTKMQTTDKILQTLSRLVTESKARNRDTVLMCSERDVVALLFHSFLLTLHFRCVSASSSDPIPVSEREVDESDAVALKYMPEGWNKRDLVSFTYQHKQSCMTFLFHYSQISNHVQISALAVDVRRSSSLSYWTM